MHINFRNAIINIITIFSGIITIFIFLTGNLTFLEIIPNIMDIPLIKTFLNFHWWTNAIFITFILYIIEKNFYKKRKIEQLRYLVKSNALIWGKETNVAFVLRQLKKIDKQYIVVRNTLLVSFFIFFSLFIYNTNLLSDIKLPKKCLINLTNTPNENWLICTDLTNKLFDTNITIKGDSNLNSVFHQISKFSIFPKKIELFLSAPKPVILIENKWAFIIITIFILTLILNVLIDIFYLKILLVIKKLNPNKHIILHRQILQTEFNELFIKNFALKKLKIPNKSLDDE